jgi:3-deoxy-7-phosphoheptulonate synthase
VLRGGKAGPNYGATHIEAAAQELVHLNLNSRIMVDCSHANAHKDHNRQPIVLEEVAAQLLAGSKHLLGVMIESHLVAGSQSLPADPSQLVYGQSITDACVDFETTAQMLRKLAQSVRDSTGVLAL